MEIISNIKFYARVCLLLTVLCLLSCSQGDYQDFVGTDVSGNDGNGGGNDQGDGKDDKDKGDENDPGDGKDDDPQSEPSILVLGYHLGAPSTRTVSQSIQFAHLDSRTRLGVSLVNSESQSVLFNNVEYMPDPSATPGEETEDRIVPVTEPGPSPLPTDETDVYVYAPYVEGIDGTAERTFSVPTDQESEADFLRGDLVVGKLTNQILTDAKPDVELKHITSRLNIKINISDGYTLEYMKGATIYVLGLKTSFDFNPVTWATSAATGGPQEIKVLTVSGEEENPSLLKGCIRVIPQMLTKGTPFFKAVFPDGHVITTNMTQNVELERNHIHEFEINLNGRNVYMQAELVGWTTVEDKTVDWDPLH